MIGEVEFRDKLRRERRYWQTAERTQIVIAILLEIDVIEKIFNGCSKVRWVTKFKKKVKR